LARRRARYAATHSIFPLGARPAEPPTMLTRWLRAQRALLFDLGIAGVIGFGGDMVSQEIERRQSDTPRPLDQLRTRSVITYFVAAALPYHFWYRGLAALFPDGTRFMVLKKLVCELSLAIPFFEIPGFTVWTGVYARDQSLTEAVAQVPARGLLCEFPCSIVAPICLTAPMSFGVAASGRLVECDMCWLASLGTKFGPHLSLCVAAVAAHDPLRGGRRVELRHQHTLLRPGRSGGRGRAAADSSLARPFCVGQGTAQL
jgi:hypothetical protein